MFAPKVLALLLCFLLGSTFVVANPVNLEGRDLTTGTSSVATVSPFSKYHLVERNGTGSAGNLSSLTDGQGTSPTYECQTSGGSPTVHDCAIAAARMYSWPDSRWCIQHQNDHGEGCTEYIRYGTCALGICGHWESMIRCNEMAAAVADVIPVCRSNGRIGGQIFWPGFHCNIYHSA